MKCLAANNTNILKKLANSTNPLDLNRVVRKSDAEIKDYTNNPRTVVATSGKNYKLNARAKQLHDGHFTVPSQCKQVVSESIKVPIVFDESVANFDRLSITAALSDDGNSIDHRDEGNLIYSKRNLILRALNQTDVKSRLNKATSSHCSKPKQIIKMLK